MPPKKLQQGKSLGKGLAELLSYNVAHKSLNLIIILTGVDPAKILGGGV